MPTIIKKLIKLAGGQSLAAIFPRKVLRKLNITDADYLKITFEKVDLFEDENKF